MKRLFAIAAVALPAAAAAQLAVDADRHAPTGILAEDKYAVWDLYDPLVDIIPPPKAPYLTESDIAAAADSLGVDTPTIHAVIEIEAGSAHKGFWTDGKPIVNFSMSTFEKKAARKGINLAKYRSQYPELFAPANKAKYGSQQAAVQARLDAAMAIDEEGAIESTFWGMFQIGGFNWRLCGTSSAKEFAEKMCDSEHAQLELFVDFIRNVKLDAPLQRHDWTAFARGYNGSSYAKRRYHTRLREAYNKHNK